MLGGIELELAACEVEIRGCVACEDSVFDRCGTERRDAMSFEVARLRVIERNAILRAFFISPIPRNIERDILFQLRRPDVSGSFQFECRLPVVRRICAC